MTTTRVLDWRLRLLTWAESVRGLPFEWGRTDCAALTRAALTMCFGRDVAPEVPMWRTAQQAAVVLARYGGVPGVLEGLGATRHTLMFARAGDVVCAPEPKEPVSRAAIGVWIDGYAVMSGAQAGVHPVGLDELLPQAPVVYSLWEIPAVGRGPYG
jgi:hypothetical protein